MRLESFKIQRGRCERHRKLLRDLARIHVDIDVRSRRIEPDEPDCVFRLRKVCLHVVAISECEVDVDGLHVMTTELRAAYEQMSAIWTWLPEEFRSDEDGGWWAREARDGLAAYNHATVVSLGLTLAAGGFGDAEAPEGYLRVAVWLGSLAAAYGLALAYLVRVLGAEGDFDSRLLSVMSSMDLK